MANSLSSLTAGVGGVQISSVDTSGSLDIKSGTTTIVSITSAGAAVTGTLSASGNLLAGTTSPLQSSQLTVYASPTPITTIDRTTNIGATVSCASSGTGYIQGGVRLGTEGNSGIYGYDDGASGAQGIGIFTGNNTTIAERMRIDSSGNVGIGTSSPATRLDVSQTNAKSATGIWQTQIFDSTSQTTGVGGGISFGGYKTAQSAAEVFAAIDAYKENSTAGNAAGALRFHTQVSGGSGLVERMRIDSSGNLLVGTTTASGKSSVSNNTNQTIAYLNADSGAYTADALYIQVATTSTNQYNFINCTRTGTAVKFLVKDTGNVQNANNSYGAISDIKLKENIVDTSPKLDKLLQVKIRNYNLKTDPDHKQIGVVAQELETIFPSLIEETEDRETVTKTREVEVPAVEEILDDEGNVVTPEVEATTTTEEYTEQVLTGETTKSVKYSVFVPILIKAMQEQQAMIDELKAEIELLKGVK
jgi:hypothetical protein